MKDYITNYIIYIYERLWKTSNVQVLIIHIMSMFEYAYPVTSCLSWESVVQVGCVVVVQLKIQVVIAMDYSLEIETRKFTANKED